MRSTSKSYNGNVNDYLDFKNSDINSIKLELLHVNWLVLLDNELSSDEMLNLFINTLMNICKRYTPLKNLEVLNILYI